MAAYSGDPPPGPTHAFAETARVLFFRPNAFPLPEAPNEENGGEGPKRFYFLWPAFARQVLVRRTVRRLLNLFQAQALRLCLAGVRDPARIANLLIRPDLEDPRNTGPIHLANRILGELVAAGVIDKFSEPSESGKALFTNDLAESSETASITLFQDPWSGEVWNRFADQIPLPVVEPSPSDKPQFVRVFVGTTGRPRWERAYRTAPGEIRSIASPDAGRIVSAHRSFRTDLLNTQLRRGRQLQDDNDESTAFGREVADISGIVQVGEPSPVYMLTYAISLGELYEGELWDVADPFGLGVSRPFLRRVREIMDRPHMRRFSAALNRGLLAQGESAGGAQLAAAVRLRNEAEDSIKRTFPAEIRDHGELFEELVDMEMSALEAENAGSVADQRALARLVRTAMTTAQVALERLFVELNQRYPAAGCYRTIRLQDSDRAGNAAKLNRIAQQFGFRMGRNGRLPETLVNIRLGKIRSVADYGGRESINARLLTALIAAAADTSGKHPIGRAGRLYPELLLDIDELAQSRNEVAHAGSRLAFDPRKIRDSAEIVYRTTRVALYPEWTRARESHAGEGGPRPSHTPQPVVL